jgi:hypothetical protein
MIKKDTHISQANDNSFSFVWGLISLLLIFRHTENKLEYKKNLIRFELNIKKTFIKASNPFRPANKVSIEDCQRNIKSCFSACHKRFLSFNKMILDKMRGKGKDQVSFKSFT